MNSNTTRVHHVINSSFISTSPIMNSNSLIVIIMRLSTPQVLIINHQKSLHECELHDNSMKSTLFIPF